MISILLGRDNIRAVCSVKEGKRTPEAFSMTHVGDEGTRPGMLAQGMQTETTRVETYRWNISMISILITSKGKPAHHSGCIPGSSIIPVLKASGSQDNF